MVDGGQKVAHIRKVKSGKFQVRWRAPDGTQKGRTVKTHATAKKLQKEVEEASGLGKFWEPEQLRPELDIRTLHREFLTHESRMLAPSTLRRYTMILELWERWLLNNYGSPLPVNLLTRRIISSYYEWLGYNGRFGNPRSQQTCRKHVKAIEKMWEWAADDDLYYEKVPRVRKLKMPTPIHSASRSPTWDEMDAAINKLPSSNHRRIVIILRFTGLRWGQALGLKWSDIDIPKGTLHVRGELGKTRKEKVGRTIPLSPFLVPHLTTWERESDFIIPPYKTRGYENGSRRRMIIAWKAAQVGPDVWKQRPHHSFRKGFIAGLKRLRADDEAVQYLVGHDRGVRGHYIDASGLPLVEAISLIPKLILEADNGQIVEGI